MNDQDSEYLQIASKLLSKKGASQTCTRLRRETWFQLMVTSAEPVYRRLGAQIFLGAVRQEIKADYEAEYRSRPEIIERNRLSSRRFNQKRKKNSSSSSP